MRILNKNEKFKLSNGKVFSSHFILQQECTPSEFTPDLLIKRLSKISVTFKTQEGVILNIIKLNISWCKNGITEFV